ncbi:FlgD immunoglobulin-like domain containing protein [Streptomyces sp. NPDC012769]|uniref:FlgD immunoglobulin-like domain containing protein n=1 Tax=Streptomyces sp. NPDC012769 TaxID=3364848 RepID=UPI0036B7E1A4
MHSISERRRGRAVAAAVATAAALVSLIPLGAGTAVAAEAADTPTEVVIPAESTADPEAGSLPAAGLTGFVQGGRRGGYHWVSYADGARTEPFGTNPFSWVGPEATGTDLMADRSSLQVVFRDPKGGASQIIRVPEGQRVLTFLGTAVVTQEKTTPYGTHLLSLDQGTVVDRPLAGLPAGAVPQHQVYYPGPHGFVFHYVLDGRGTVGWVDRSFTFRPIKLPALDTSGKTSAAGRFLFRYPVQGKLQVWDVTGDWSAPVRELPWSGGTPVAVLGDHVLARVPSSDGLETLVARSFADAAELPVLDRVFGASPVGPDGRLVIARQGEGTERTLHSVAVPEAAAAPVATRIGAVPPARTHIHGTAVAQGVVHSVDDVAYSNIRLRSIELSTGRELSAGPRVDLGADANILQGGCWVSGDCRNGVPTGDGRVVFHEAGYRGGLYVLDPGKQLPATRVSGVDDVTGDITASGRYVAYATAAETRVLDLDTHTVVLRRPYGGHGAAIVGDTLWEGAAGGVLKAVDVHSGSVIRSVKVADCELGSWSVVGEHALTSCGDTSTAQDLRTGRKTAVPGRFARLGDGFALSVQGADTVLTPLRGESGPRVITPADAKAPAWSIDRFGGPLVYTDDQERIHAVPTGVPASDLSVIDSDAPQILDLKAPAGWTGRWWLSKPAASWTLTLKDRTGNALRTLRGGETRGLVRAAWDGKGDNGAELAEGPYAWDLTVVPADGVGAEVRRAGEVFLTSTGLGTFEPVAPARILNTLGGVGAPQTKVGPGATVTLQVTGRGGVTRPGVTAVVLNVTATNPTAATYVSVYPYGMPRPATSSLNVAKGRTAPNLVTVPVGRDGKVSLYNHSGSVDLLADVAGYYTLAGDGDRFAPVAPARLLNTLGGVGAPKAKLGAARTVSLQVTGRGGVPATGVTAVTVNVTATNPTAASFVSVYPYGTTRPATSNLNVVAGQTVANLVTVPVRDGRITLYNHSGSVDLLADVFGYFTDVAGKGDRFKPVAPARVLNTMGGVGAPQAKVAPGRSLDLLLAGSGELPSLGVSAVVMNVTATQPTAATYVAAYPFGTRPSTSNLNVAAGETVANQAVVPLYEGTMSLYNHSAYVHLLADVAGYYTK